VNLDLASSNGAREVGKEEAIVLSAFEQQPARDGAVEDVMPGAWLIVA
jgi:hypothetical protein